MLPLPNIEELQALLLEIPRLVSLYEARDCDFPERVKAWFQRTETALQENRLPLAGSLAALRGTIITAERRVGPPAPLTSPQKLRDAAAADALRRAEELVSEYLRPDLAQLRDAERVVRHMMAVAQYRGVTNIPVVGLSYSDMINLLWSRFLGDHELAPMAVRTTGLVGAHNALFLLGRELSLAAGLD